MVKSVQVDRTAGPPYSPQVPNPVHTQLSFIQFLGQVLTTSRLTLYHARSLVEVSKCLELQRQYGIKFLAMGLMVRF